LNFFKCLLIYLCTIYYYCLYFFFNAEFQYFMYHIFNMYNVIVCFFRRIKKLRILITCLKCKLHNDNVSPYYFITYFIVQLYLHLN